MPDAIPWKVATLCRGFCSGSDGILKAFEGVQSRAAASAAPLRIADIRAEWLAPENIQAEWLTGMLLLLWGGFCRNVVAACSQDADCRLKGISWHSAEAVNKECRRLREDGRMSLAACAAVMNVVSAPDSPAGKITAARNLFAHRSHQSWRRFREAFPNWRPGNYLGMTVCGRILPDAGGATQMEFWVKRLQTLSKQMERDLCLPQSPR